MVKHMEDYSHSETSVADSNGQSAEKTSYSDRAPVSTTTPAVWSCNEWDPLEEVIVGNPLNARFPNADRSTQVAEYPDRLISTIPRGPFPQRVIEETEEDLNEFAQILEG